MAITIEEELAALIAWLNAASAERMRRIEAVCAA
jgi:hypothetical protein